MFFAGSDTIKIVQHFTKKQRNDSQICPEATHLRRFFSQVRFGIRAEISHHHLRSTTFSKGTSCRVEPKSIRRSACPFRFWSSPTVRIVMMIQSMARMGMITRWMLICAKAIHQEESEKVTSSNAHTDVSYVCIRKTIRQGSSALGRCQRTCALLTVEKSTGWSIKNKKIPWWSRRTRFKRSSKQIKSDLLNVFISTLKCGHYESQLAVYPSIKPAILSVTLPIVLRLRYRSLHLGKTTGELPPTLQHIDREWIYWIVFDPKCHGHIQAHSSAYSTLCASQKLAVPMFATKKSATAASSSSTAPTTTTNQKKSNTANNFYYLLLVSLKKEKSAALIFGQRSMVWSDPLSEIRTKEEIESFDSVRLRAGRLHSVDIQFSKRLGPYAVVFPPANNGELVYKKQAWPVKQFPRSYTETFLIWCRQKTTSRYSFSLGDIWSIPVDGIFTRMISTKFVRASAKLPDKVNIFYRVRTRDW